MPLTATNVISVLSLSPRVGNYQPTCSNQEHPTKDHEGNVRKTDACCQIDQGGKTVPAIVMNIEMEPSVEESVSQCIQNNVIAREHSLHPPWNENIFEERNHLVNIETYNPRSDKVDVSKAFESLASQRLMGFLSELRKNHEDAMVMSGLEQKCTYNTTAHGNQSVFSSSFKEEIQPETKKSPVRTVSQTFSTSATSSHDTFSTSAHSSYNSSSASPFDQSIVPSMWSDNMKFQRVRDFDAVSSISGDTGCSHGRKKSESIAGGAMNDAHETESSSSSEFNTSSTEGAYHSSSGNTSGNSTSDDELGNASTVKDRHDYVSTSFSGPLRKRLKQVRDSMDE